MLKPTTGHLLPLLLAGSLFSVACAGDDEGDPYEPPLTTLDSGITTADAGPAVPDAGGSTDAGNLPPRMDSSVQPVLDAGRDTGTPTGSDAAATDAASPDAGSADGSVSTDAGGDGGAVVGKGECCAAGKECLCHGPAPTRLSNDPGPYRMIESFNLSGVGCVFYPTDGKPPYAAVAVSDGAGGTGGCNSTQTGGWSRFYASHGIVVINVIVPSSGVPERGVRLLGGIRALKAENEKSSSPLFNKLAGRYGVTGFSMGGGGTTHAASDDPTLKSAVGLMSHRPVSDVTVPTLFTCGSSDNDILGGCGAHGRPAYDRFPAATPRAIVTVNAGHAGNPTAGGGNQGAYALAFQKVFLDGDERWLTLLKSIRFDDSKMLP
jgi:hypothetical protein